MDSRFVFGGMKGARQEWERKVERNFVSEVGALHSEARQDKDVNNFKEISIYKIVKCHRSKQAKPEKRDRKRQKVGPCRRRSGPFSGQLSEVLPWRPPDPRDK